ncbi:glutamic acid-rich protein precursor, putative, partial [Entamoeba dispar SAW760]
MSDIEKTPETHENQTIRISTPPLENEEKRTDEVVKKLCSKEMSSDKKRTRSSSNNEVEENGEKEETDQEGKDKEKKVSRERLLSFMFKRKTNEKTTISESPKKSHKEKKKEGEEEEGKLKRKELKKSKKQQLLKQSKSEIITKKSEEIDSQELIIEHQGDAIIDNNTSQKENEEKSKRKEGIKERPKSLKEKLSPRKENKEEKKELKIEKEKKVKDIKNKKEVIDKGMYKEEGYKNDIWKRKTICTMERREKEKRRSSEISIKKEKKNIEVTVEIGFLLQTYNKTLKVPSQMKVREVIEKTMISIKEGLHDDVIVYQSNGEVVNQEENIGTVAINNKAYIYVSK